MASSIEVREKHKWHLHSLLIIKKANASTTVQQLQEEINAAIAIMEQEDVAWVEKIAGVKAL